MELTITTYGSYLHVKDGCFEVKVDETKAQFSVKKISSIHIATKASLSTDAIKLALDNNIDIVFLDDYKGAYARVWFPKIGSTVKIRRRQLEISDKKEGFDLSKEWMLIKIDNQVSFLRELGYKRPAKELYFKDSIAYILELRKSIDLLIFDENIIPSIMGYEGNISKKYFEVLSMIMPKGFEFNGRSRQPALDKFNCMLNYSYSVIYSMVEKACIIAGLDPYIGFVHADNYNKKSLVFDIIELFRVYADIPVTHLCTCKRMNVDCFEQLDGGGVILNKQGKKELLVQFYNHLDEKIRHRNRQVSRKTAIQLECHHVAQTILNG
ncbi:MAG: CRISPR-associated endonuclease Cas1 [Candidatus Margulisbacteria bacterium]|nr:CRISPR-associated endonuclease Cas1 [Candidatus Margulisiibacteriota bacterium]